MRRNPALAKFKYTALTPDGSAITGVEHASSAARATVALAERDLKPIAVMEKKNILQFEITRKKVPRRELMHFSRQMAVFIKAGIPILDGLEVIATEQSDKLFKRTIDEMIDGLRAGETFADAAAVHPAAFPSYYVSILRSAELTGNLDVVLDQLGDYIERDIDARQKVTAALVYPVIVMLMSIVTVVILTVYVLPKFRVFFESLNAKLPLPTRMLLSTSHFLSTWWIAIVGLVIALLIVAALGQRTQRGRDIRDRLILKLPGFGDVVQHAILERFCRILSSMAKAGVSLDTALSVTSEATNNAVYRRAIITARESMLNGEGLAGPLSRTGLFPGAVRQMMTVGEQTGSLDEQLQIAAVYYERELDHKIKRFTSLFEPAIIVFVGVIVGFVAIALVSAMYGIYHQVKIQ